MNLFTLGWLLIFTAGLALEAVAYFNRRRGDTLSEVTWGLLERWRWRNGDEDA